jgi:hypothetical protein
MKLVVRVPLDLVGRWDSVQNLVELLLTTKTLLVCSVPVFVPWEKNRDPFAPSRRSFFENKLLIGYFVLSGIRAL